MSVRQDPQFLAQRIRDLEERVSHLRVSRRVLMNLIERMDRENNLLLGRLQRENRRLLRHNQVYALELFRKNSRIVELETTENCHVDRQDS